MTDRKKTRSWWKNRTGKVPLAGYEEAAKPQVLKRIDASVSGYVLVKRFRDTSKRAASDLVDEGVLEIFDSPTGKAYRRSQDA